MVARVLAMALCLYLSVHVRLSQIDVLSKVMDELIIVLAWRPFLASPALCYKEIQVSTK